MKEKINDINWKKIIVMVGIAMILSLSASMSLTTHLWELQDVRVRIVESDKWLVFQRAWIFFFVFLFIECHFVFSIKRMYAWIFDKRWILGILFLLFLTANRYNGDSIGYYDLVVQPNITDASMKPILGKIRTIRSDEFAVNSPAVFASQYGENPYGKYNNIARGTDTLNIIMGAYAGYATVGYAPWELIYSILPLEFAFSFCWFAPIILSFLLSIELYLILSNEDKIVSATGAALTIGSAFYLWWGFPTFIMSGAGTIVCIHYFLHNKSTWKKLLFGIGIAIFFSIFVTNLYPAWQVPAGYIFLVIGIWLIHEHWMQIKSLNKKDWFIILGCIIFMISLILSYFYVSQDYLKAITETVYPGARSDSGGFGLQKLFYYSQSSFYAYKDVGNPSEFGVFFSCFPIPTIMALYYWIKSKKKDWLTGGLLIVSIPLILYITTGLPDVIAKILLLSHCTVTRVVDVVGLLQIYFIVIVLSRYADIKEMNRVVALAISAFTAGISIYVTHHYFPDYLPLLLKVMMFVLIFVICFGLTVRLTKEKRTCLCIGLIVLSLFTGICIRPVSIGLNSIFAKPAAEEIQRICESDKDAKWIAYGGGIVLPSFTLSCGAPTINSVNFYPNMQLWETLDEKREYEEIYNRYAHIQVCFIDGETNFEIVNSQADLVQLNLSYKDIYKTQAKYIFTVDDPTQFISNKYVSFDKVYQEDGACIFKLTYLK